MQYHCLRHNQAVSDENVSTDTIAHAIAGVPWRRQNLALKRPDLKYFAVLKMTAALRLGSSQTTYDDVPTGTLSKC
jgi:hypothetical protein